MGSTPSVPRKLDVSKEAASLEKLSHFRNLKDHSKKKDDIASSLTTLDSN